MATTDSKEGTSTDFDDQLNVPVRSEDKSRFRVEAAEKGISMSELARQRLFGKEAETVPA